MATKNMTKTDKKNKTQSAKRSGVDSDSAATLNSQVITEVASQADPEAGPVSANDETDAASLAKRVESLEESLLRAKADYQNLQRRTTQEKSDAIRYANLELMRSLVSVLDDFDRAIESLESSHADKNTVEGIRLVHQNFMRSLTDLGMEPINALNMAFDPYLHEALLQQPSKDHKPDTVMQEIAKGYRLGDRIIRPAKVVVAKLPEDID